MTLSPGGARGADPAGAPRHLPPLDGLRGLAILLVIPHNAIASLADNPCAVKCGGTTWAAMLLVNVGWIGVQIFFVLSGFLITRNLLDSLGAPNYYRAFYVRRALRILPLYYGTLAVVFLLLPLVGLHPLGDDGGARDRLWFWVFLSNWSVPLGAAACGLPHFWSLAVEEQFYLAWPALVRRVTAVGFLRLCTALAVLALGVRIAMVAAGADSFVVYEFTISRMDALAIGAAAAVVFRDPALLARLRGATRSLLGASVAILLAGAVVTRGYPRARPVNEIVGFSALAIGFALLLLAAVAPEGRAERGLASVLSWRWLRLAGKYSYGAYVFHEPLALGLARLEPRFAAVAGPFHIVAWLLAVVLSTAAAAVASFHLYEARFLRWKDRFDPRPAELGSPT